MALCSGLFGQPLIALIKFLTFSVVRVFYTLFGTVVFFIAFYLDEESSYYHQITNNLNDLNLYLTLLYALVVSLVLNELIYGGGVKVLKAKATYYIAALLIIMLIKIGYNVFI